MPNWCENTATFTHEKTNKINALENELVKWNNGDECQMFEHLRPVGDTEDWYMKHVGQWGTKWDASIQNWERVDENTIRVDFDTAWAPPTALYEYLREHGWVIEAYYHEGGNAFVGMFTDDNGDEYHEYDIEDIKSIEELPQELLDTYPIMEWHEDWISENEDNGTV